MAARLFERTKALRIGFTCNEVGLVNGLPQSRTNATGTRYARMYADRRLEGSTENLGQRLPSSKALVDADNKEPFEQPKN